MSDTAGTGEDPVVDFIVERLRSKTADAVDVEEIVPDTLLHRDLGLSSLPLIDLLMAMEQHFGTPLVDVEIDPAGIRSVGDLIGIGRQLVAARKE